MMVNVKGEFCDHAVIQTSIWDNCGIQHSDNLFSTYELDNINITYNVLIINYARDRARPFLCVFSGMKKYHRGLRLVTDNCNLKGSNKLKI